MFYAIFLNDQAPWFDNLEAVRGDDDDDVEPLADEKASTQVYSDDDVASDTFSDEELAARLGL